LQSFKDNGQNNNCTGAFSTALQYWPAQAWNYNNTAGGTSFYGSVGITPLATYEGGFSTIFQHPPGETYLFNVIGSVATGQGQIKLKGPYRPDNQDQPINRAFRINIIASGGTDGGTEGFYRFYRASTQRQDGYDYGTNASAGFYISEMSTSQDGAMTPDAYWPATSVTYDGRGMYWAAGRGNPASSGQGAGPGGALGANRLYAWKAHTCEQILIKLDDDSTRLYGITPRDALIATPWIGDFIYPWNHTGKTYGGFWSAPALDSNQDGLVYFPTRMAASGQQAIYVIDNQKPGRYYQRPTGVVTTGSNNFQVANSDEVHEMFPFVTGSVGADGVTGGDVGRKIRIVGSTNGNDGVRTITAFVDAKNVTVDGAPFAAESGLTWHWVVVTKRDSTNGLTDRVRVLKYDKANSRLWAWTDSGIQMSTDHGLTWSGLIANGTGLTSTGSERCLVPDGRSGNNTCAIGNSGELYWMSDGSTTPGGAVSSSNMYLNKYVGTGPGGTHTAILCSTFTNFNINYPPFCMQYDPCAPDMPGTEGSLWIGSIYSSASFWRLKCDVFTQANMNNYSNPTVYTAINGGGGYANKLNHGVQMICIGPGGGVALSNHSSMQEGSGGNFVWANFDYGQKWPATPGTFYTWYSLYPAGLNTNTTARQGFGAWWAGLSGEKYDDMACKFWGYGSEQYAALGLGLEYYWNPVASKWQPWFGTDGQWNTRHGITAGSEGYNGGRKCHAGYKLLRDSVYIAFQQNGTVAQTEEYKVGENYSFITTMGVHRTNIQDLSWEFDFSYCSTVSYLETEPIKTVPANGGLTVPVYVQSLSFGAWSTIDPSRPLGTVGGYTGGAGAVPELVSATGRKAGGIPNHYTYYCQRQGGLIANDIPGPQGGAQAYFASIGWVMGLDLGSPTEVTKLRFQIYDNWWSWFGVYGAWDAASGSMRVYASNDNATWVELENCRHISNTFNSDQSNNTGCNITAGSDANHPYISTPNWWTSGSASNTGPERNWYPIGQYVTISGAASAVNNGLFQITNVLTDGRIEVYNPSGAVTPDANNGGAIRATRCPTAYPHTGGGRTVDPGYRFVTRAGNFAQTDASQGHDSYNQMVTFHLDDAGYLPAARTYRYWKVMVVGGRAQVGGNENYRDGNWFGWFAAYGSDGHALTVDAACRLPEADDYNVIGTPVKQVHFIQDRVGISGKGGINSTPDALGDGFTDVVTIASGTFNTGAINTLTDYLAFRHPATGQFLKNDVNAPGGVSSAAGAGGHPGAIGESTQVRILQATTTTITVDRRSIPGTLAGADWEVRRPAKFRNDYAYDPGDVVNPFAGSGYLQFHPSDAGREFRVTQRMVLYRP